MNFYKQIRTFIFSLCLMVFGISYLSQAQTTLKASLSGSNEIPAITTTANGNITATLTGTELVVTGSFSDLSSDYAASHIHTAMAGTNGGVAFTLSPTIDVDNKGGTFVGTNNTFTLTTEQISMIEAQGMYINIHSANYAGGELRGQLVPESDAYFKANLSGAFEVPAAKTMASGGVVLQMEGDSLFISGSFNNLSSTYAASHLHIAAAGSSGDVAFVLSADTETDGLSGTYLAANNRFELNASQKTALMNREFYVNIHTANFAGGELRGQVTPPVTTSFFATLSGSAENPSVQSNASGAVLLELIADTAWVTGSFNGLESNYAASHIHTAISGTNGGVAFALTADVDVDANNVDGVYVATDNKFTLTAEQKATLLSRGMYINIHSANNPGGELRGQVLGDATAYFRTNLAGIHEVQPVEATATGALSVEISGSNAIVTGSYNGLSSDFSGAHIHSGSVDATGGVEVALSNTASTTTDGIFEVLNNTYALTNDQLTAMFAGGLYGNVHSANNAGGELRGQLLFGTNTFAEVSNLTSPDDGADLTLSTDLITAFSATWETSTDADGNDIAYIWQLSTDANFNNIIVNTNTGSTAMFSTTHGTLDALLVEAGIEMGATATLYHRVIVTDGSDEAVSNSRTVDVTRANLALGFEAILSGSNEAPPITTTANGSISATLTGTELVVEGSFEGLTGDYAASHIHMAMAGASGGVVVALSPTINADERGGTFVADNNTFTLTTGQADTLRMQGMYINIHSSTFAAGELRGQIVPEADAHYRANFSGAFEFPIAKTMASGGAVLQLKGDSLIISGSFSNLSDEFDVAVAGGSHLHIAPAGRTGGIALELTPTLDEGNLSGVYLASENRFELTSEQKAALMNRDFYFNLHTKAFPSGELRGQVVPQSTATFFASLSGTAEVPSIETSAIGAIVLELHQDTLVVTGSFGNLNGAFDATIAGGSHLHIGHAGENGGIAVQLDADVGIDLSGGVYVAEENKYTLTSEQIEALMERKMYLNIHTLAFGSGELRGQVLGEAAAYFRTNLSGIHEVQPILSPAYGALNVELSSNNTAIVTGGFSGLTGNFDANIAGGAHLHAGPVTGNGGIEANLNTTVDQDTAGFYEASLNSISLTSEQAATLMAEGMYANIHTSTFGSGELRGQLLFGNNIFPNAAELTAPANDASLTLSGDAGILFEATWDEGSDLDNNEIAYIWQLSSDATFTDLLVNANVGAETSFSADFGTLATIFDNAGIEVGTTANLYHRVITSDGSNEKASEPRTANIERGQITSNEDELGTEPLKFGLNQNYPNPFNPSTSISFTLSETGNASLKVYNMLGQEVATLANTRLTAGSYTYSFDASQLSSGMYIYQLRAENQTVTKRMTLIK